MCLLHVALLFSVIWRLKSESEWTHPTVMAKNSQNVKNILKEMSWAVPATQFISSLLIFDSTYSRQEALPWKYVSKDHWVINTQKIKIKTSQYNPIFLGVHKLLVAWGKRFNRDNFLSPPKLFITAEPRLTDLCALNKTCKSEHTQNHCYKNNM